MKLLFNLAILIATIPLCAQNNVPVETSPDTVKLHFQVYAQGGYGYSASSGAPIRLASHFDEPNVVLLAGLQDSPTSWVVEPQFTFGFSLLNHRSNNFTLGLETDASFLNFSATQNYATQNKQQQLNFSGTEWRWNFKVVQGYKVNRMLFRIDGGFSYGFAKDYQASLLENNGSTNTFIANKAPFKNADFSFTYGIGVSYDLTKKWHLTAIWENNLITTGKYTIHSEWFGDVQQKFQFTASQISLRVSYQIGTANHLQKHAKK